MQPENIDQLELKTRDIADLFGVNPRQVREWAKEGCPKVSYGRWNLKDVLQWYLARIRSQSDRTEASAEFDKHKAKYWEAKADRERIAADKTLGKLIDKAEVVKQWTARVVEVTAGLEAFAKRLPPRLVGKKQAEMTRIIKDEVWNLRDQYARKGKYTP